MSLEQMAYKMMPAGHEEPQPKRKYPKPKKELEEALEWYLIKMKNTILLPQDYYDLARSLIKNIHCTVDEAHALLLCNEDNKDTPITYLEYFVGAIYNKARQKNVIYDLPLADARIGFNLARDKRLIILENAECGVGQYADGTIISYGKLRKPAREISSSALLINCGRASPYLAVSSNGVVINFGVQEGDWLTVDSRGLVVDWGEKRSDTKDYTKGTLVSISCQEPCHEGCKIYQPSLAMRTYLNALKDKFMAGKDDYRKTIAAINGLGREPAQKIEQKVKEILRRDGCNAC